MTASTALRALGIAVFTALVAPAIGFVGFAAADSAAQGSLTFPRLAELPGFYVDTAGMVAISAAIFTFSLMAATTHGSALAIRLRITLLSTLTFAAVFTAPAVEGALLRGHVSAVHLLIASLGVVAGFATGAMLPRALIPSASTADDA